MLLTLARVLQAPDRGAHVCGTNREDCGGGRLRDFVLC